MNQKKRNGGERGREGEKQTCLVGIPEEEHGVLKEEHCGDKSEVAEAKRE